MRLHAHFLLSWLAPGACFATETGDDPHRAGADPLDEDVPTQSQRLADPEQRLLGSPHRDMQLGVASTTSDDGRHQPTLADALDMPEGTVRSRLRRALELLREQLVDSPGLSDAADGDFESWARELRRANEP